MKRVLRILLLALLLIPISLLTWLTATESGLHWAFHQAEPYLPGHLTLNELEGRLLGPITAKGIEYQQDGVLIKADQIILDWQLSALLVTQIDINRLHVQSLKIIVPTSAETEQPLKLPAIHLPWRVDVKDTVIDDFSISQNEQTIDLKQIRLNASTLFSQLDINALDITHDIYSLKIKGGIQLLRHYRHDLNIQWQLKLPTKTVIKGSGQLSGNIQKTRIKQLLHGPLQMSLSGELNNLLDQLNWQAKADITKFNTAELLVDWPAVSGELQLQGKGDLTTATVSGILDANHVDMGPFDARFNLQRLSDNRIQIDQLRLHSPVSETHIDGHGQWQPGVKGGDLVLSLHWQNLRWPLKDTAWFNSASGSGSIVGNLDHYNFEIDTDRPWSQAPHSTWHAKGEGNLDGINFHSLEVTMLDGKAIASGQLNWSPGFNWKAKATASEINPAILLPQWPGKLSGQLISTGRFDNGQLIADADISQLKGTLRNHPVSLRSTLSWNNKGLDITRLDFRSGRSRISANGRVGETLKLDWRITTSDLAELYPQAQGQLQASGSLNGPRNAPMINVNIDGKALKLQDYEIGTINGVIAFDLLQRQQTDIKLEAQALKLNNYVMQLLAINADNNLLKLKAVSELATTHIEIQGETNVNGWQGYIKQARIESLRLGNWQLKAPSKLTFNKKNLVLESLCWHNNQQASLCATIHHKNATWRSDLNASKLPLLLFSPWLPADLQLDGTVDVTAELEFGAPDRLLGHIDLELAKGTISYPLVEGERDRWEYRSGKVKVTLNDQGVVATIGLAMNNGDRVDGQVALPGAQLLTLKRDHQPLQASVALTSHDLGLIEALVPEVYELHGIVDLNLSVTGTLGQPRLSGHAQLLNGSLRIPRLGLTIDQLNLKSQSDGLKQLNFKLDAHSGDGKLAIQGQTTLDRNAGWPTTITIKGDQFEVSRIPEARIQASSDLQVKLQDHTIDITGKVHIPYAKLQPKDITTAARVSSDAVIIGGEQPPQEQWSNRTKIRLTLGEQVNLFGFGFDGRLSGSLLLEDEPGQLTKATGEITVPEGRYRAYGQRLDVEHGRLLYTGGPLSNPGLDLRAVRHINNVTAGLKLKGSLNQPQLELFSSPAMGQTDILAYILLGRPMENASGEESAMMAKAALALGLSGGDRLARILGDRFGLDEMRVESSDTGEQASLVIGRYLSPKIYVSYGVGLIETINTFTVRYQISDKWQIKAESGESQGADIIYTIER